MSFPTFPPMLTQVPFWKPLWRARKSSHKFAGAQVFLVGNWRGRGDQGLQQVSLKLVSVNKFGVILLGWWIGSIPVSSFQFSHVELWLISSVFSSKLHEKIKDLKKNPLDTRYEFGRDFTDYRWLCRVRKQVRYVSTSCAHFYSLLETPSRHLHILGFPVWGDRLVLSGKSSLEIAVRSCAWNKPSYLIPLKQTWQHVAPENMVVQRQSYPFENAQPRRCFPNWTSDISAHDLQWTLHPLCVLCSTGQAPNWYSTKKQSDGKVTGESHSSFRFEMPRSLWKPKSKFAFPCDLWSCKTVVSLDTFLGGRPQYPV